MAKKTQSATKRLLVSSATTAMIVGSTHAVAYDIFPGRLAALKGFTAIHEQMALASWECSLTIDPKIALASSCTWPDFTNYIDNARPQLQDPDWILIRGVEWPDNPRRTAPTFIWHLFTSQFRKNLGFVATMLEHCSGYTNTTGGLLCKSHYYDMQFLHAMSPSCKDNSGQVQAKIMAWLQLIYSAIQDVKTSSVKDATVLNETMAELMKRKEYQAIAPALTGKSENVDMSQWTLWQLLSMTDARHVATEIHPDILVYPIHFLLGVMLHTIEDSYSTAHTLRVASQLPDSPTVSCGVIQTFYTYMGQNSKEHSKYDKAPNLSPSCPTQGEQIPRVSSANANSKSLPVVDPITAGANLIAMARDQVPWPEVSKYLLTQVIVTDGLNQMTTNGPEPLAPKDATCQDADTGR